MSAYSHSKPVLSARELFKYRLKKQTSLPDRGGPKEFEPDGSWLQSKSLEALIQEKTSIISEPRVEKLKHLVEGVWDEDKRLVNLKKPGKFWMHMGFTDSRRNWLYPEEALFLLETNNLEIFFNGIPLSIQEAYTRLLGAGVSVDEYQVFAHLRRLGFVVLRFENERVFTDYECKIKIDQYSKKKKTKQKNKSKEAAESSVDGHQPSNELGQEVPSSVNIDEDKSAKPVQEKIADSGSSTDLGSKVLQSDKSSEPSDVALKEEFDSGSQKRPLSSDEHSRDETITKKIRTNDDVDKDRLQSDDRFSEFDDRTFRDFFNISSWSTHLRGEKQGHEEESDIENKCVSQSEADLAADISFPDIANKQTLTLKCSEVKLFTPTTDSLAQFVFDVADYRAKNPAAPITKEEKCEDEHEMRVKDLNFSFPDLVQKKPQIEAKSWSEYKKKIGEITTEASAPTPLDHLWNDSITPLIKPEDATSYEKILENLRIVQSASNQTLLPDSVPTDDVKVSYDVHLPDQRFKKSMPGVPNHRVCVSSSDDGPPTLGVIQHLWSQCKDGVPLHWALVDGGEISFFVFNNKHSLETLR